MKKRAAFLITLILLLGVVGCAGEESAPVVASASGTATTAVSAPAAVAIETTSAPTAKPTAEPTPEPTPEPLNNIKSEPVGDLDYTIFQGLDGYDYSKFDKCWSVASLYDYEFSDADVYIGIKLWGEDGGNNLEEAQLITRIVDKSGEVIDIVDAMAFLIDDKIYRYDEMADKDGSMAGRVFLYDTGYEIVKAFANAKSISVQLSTYDHGMLELDLNSTQFSNTVGKLCRIIVDNHVWDYYINNAFQKYR